MGDAVFVLGGGQTDFSRHLSREGRVLDDLVAEVIDLALDDARVDASEVGAVHVGNAFGELFTGQAHLGAMPATVRAGLWGAPATRHEAACASGGVAILAAMAALESGRCDCALVVGVEQERNVPGDVAARHMGAAAWVGREGEGARYLWPSMFSRVAEVYAERWGLDRRHLAAIAEKNLSNARANPLAQTRAWRFTDASFSDDDESNPVVEGCVRRTDCAQVTDGAAAVVLCTERFLRGRRLGRAAARVAGWGHRTAGLGLDEKLRRSAGGGHLLPHLRDAVADAMRRASVEDWRGLDGVETHDCFTITEYMAVDHFGVTAPGEAWKAIEEGVTSRGGAIPFNASGGLIGVGHPVGATGVRMVRDAARQVEGRAGDAQVEGARRFGVLNIGGSGTTAVSFVLSA
ncbi:MAG: acetyl-CoA acetyltransferase [Polyangiales bacterium]